MSFYIHNVHYNLIVRLLSDRFGIQVRGGCSCAGTYGHYLLNVTKETSKNITDQIDMGCLLQKPGWVRMSIHPTMSNKEAEYIAHAIEQVAKYNQEWAQDYFYDAVNNDYKHHTTPKTEYDLAAKWFRMSLV
jgi:selenocysteine lyase/cysteine desulfurase